MGTLFATRAKYMKIVQKKKKAFAGQSIFSFPLSTSVSNIKACIFLETNNNKRVHQTLILITF